MADIWEFNYAIGRIACYNRIADKQRLYSTILIMRVAENEVSESCLPCVFACSTYCDVVLPEVRRWLQIQH